MQGTWGSVVVKALRYWSYGLGIEPWPTYFGWTTDNSHKTGLFGPISNTATPTRDRLRSSGLWRTSYTTDYYHKGVFPYRNMWTSCAGPGGSYTNSPSAPGLLAGI